MAEFHKSLVALYPISKSEKKKILRFMAEIPPQNFSHEPENFLMKEQGILALRGYAETVANEHGFRWTEDSMDKFMTHGAKILGLSGNWKDFGLELEAVIDIY